MKSCFSSQRIKNFKCLLRNPKEARKYSRSRTCLSLLQRGMISLPVTTSIKKKRRKEKGKIDHFFKILHSSLFADKWAMAPDVGHMVPRPVTTVCGSYLCMSLDLGLSCRAEKPRAWPFLMYGSEVANGAQGLDWPIVLFCLACTVFF